MKRMRDGFTLIELLVVIAIIGILSAVVLGQLSSARTRGADAAIKENLNNIRAKAQLFYELSANNNYNNMCLDSNIAAIKNAAGAQCSSANQQWRVSAVLNLQNQCSANSGPDYWCVDASGIPRLEDNAPAGNACAIPDCS